MTTRAVLPLAVLIALAGCERERRPFDDHAVAAAAMPAESQSPLQAGAPLPPPGSSNPYQNNAWAISEGKRFFVAYNCNGCHAYGGGGIGPALMDDEWIYGFEPANIYGAILEGRPNGMPSFRNKIPDQQIWQLVAYVQSMSGQAPQAAMPSRSDHMRYSTPENARRAQTPVRTGQP
jgi:cytochrome c oxidase cbb3-type subunit 3